MPLTRDPSNPRCALEAPAEIDPPPAYYFREFASKRFKREYLLE